MQVYIGIDWSEEQHQVSFMNQAGAELISIPISHKLEGFAKFEARRSEFGLAIQDCVVGIETAHSLLVDYLWSCGYRQLYVLPPNLVHENQSRYRQSGAKDDRSDALLIADIVRTDHGRLSLWRPDSLLIRQMRVQLSSVMQFTSEVTRLSNRLRAILLRYYPAALEVFSTGLTTQIAPEFIRAYSTPQAARSLSWAEFQAFARQHHYANPQRLAACFARLQADYPETSPETALIFQDEAVRLAGFLLEATRNKIDSQRRLQSLYRQHPKHPVFASLPAAGDLIGPGLLAKFGDTPERFPSPAVVQALAGTCPVTKRSGKSKTVRFRYACDKEWRHLCQEWATALVHRAQSPIARGYYDQLRRRGHTEEHAYRCVAHRWLAVAWKLWQTDQLYDEAYHFQQRALRSQPH